MAHDLKAHVQSIARDLENGISHTQCPECGGEIRASFPGAECLKCNWQGGEYLSGFDYLQDALDIEYVVNGKGEYLGARVLVAFGGPNIWINTRTKTVEGAWWSEAHTERYSDDAMGLDEALEEMWACV